MPDYEEPEIEVLIITGATTSKVEANNTSIKHIKRTGRGFVNSTNCTTRIMLGSAARTAVNIHDNNGIRHEPWRASLFFMIVPKTKSALWEERN